MSDNADSGSILPWRKMAGAVMTAGALVVASGAALLGARLSSIGVLGEFPVVLPVIAVFVAVSLVERGAEMLAARFHRSKDDHA